MRPPEIVQSRPSAAKLEDVTFPADIGAFYEREIGRLVLFVTAVSSGLDVHAASRTRFVLRRLAETTVVSAWNTMERDGPP
jgi:hypothetical protein